MKWTKLLSAVSAIALCVVLLHAIMPSHVVATTLPFPSSSTVLAPDLPISHTDNGFELMDAAPFIDANNRLLVPLRFIAEALGATVQYNAPEILVTYGTLRVTLELDKPEAMVNDESVTLDSSPLLQGNRTYVPLRFLSTALGYPIHYRDGIIVVGSSFSEPSEEEAASWKHALNERHILINPAWEMQEIPPYMISYAPQVRQEYSYFYRWLGNDLYAVYQTTGARPGEALLICDNVEYNNSFYGTEGNIVWNSLLVTPDALYGLLHTGGATMGAEYIYKLSSETGSNILVNSRMSGDLALHDGCIYFTMNIAFGPNTTYRIGKDDFYSADDLNAFERYKPIGRSDFFYGYVVITREDGGRSGGGTGFCIDGDYLYANAFQSDDGNATQEDMAFYRVDLRTMEHEQLQQRLLSNPRVVGSWIYAVEHTEVGTIFIRMHLDGSGFEELVYDVLEYSYEGNQFVYLLQEGIADSYEDFVWERYTMLADE